jgi:ribosomal protein S18 acetylase RimI-like enzyme
MKINEIINENAAAGINKMFNNLGDPVYANLQRVALLAMQGRQSEAAGRLQTVIKDASPDVQKKITDAVNNIKPVTINGKIADSSTLDKSKQHNNWIINTFIPWVQSLLGQQGVAESKTVEYNGLTLRIKKPTSYELRVEALDDWGNKVLGYVEFDIGDGKELDPQDLRVDDKYQGQGIAKTMYDYVKQLGYTIVRSWDQTDAGAGFWDKHRGEDVRVWEQDLEEEQLDELSFLGSECTKDCSGHRAGYDWSKKKGLRQANSWSPSFNTGAGLAVAGK